MTNKHPYEKTHPRKREWVVETIAWGPEGGLPAIVNCARERKPVSGALSQIPILKFTPLLFSAQLNMSNPQRTSLPKRKKTLPLTR